MNKKTVSLSHEVLERTRSNEDKLLGEASDNVISFEEMKPYLDLIPEKEQDIIDLYFFSGKKQKDIAAFFGVSQGAISHRISRAKKRLIFLRDMPKVSHEDLRLAISSVLPPLETEIVCSMCKTTCQSETADIVNKKLSLSGDKVLTQIKVRHKFDKSVEKIREEIASGKTYLAPSLELMVYTRKNPYMLHEVCLPHFNRGYKASMDHTA